MLLVLFLIGSSGATIISDSISLSIDQQGIKTMERSLIVGINNQRGREEFGDIEIRYSKGSDFEIVKAYTKLPDGSIHRPEEKGISDVSAPETHRAPMYSSNLLRVVSFRQVKSGAEIHYKYRIKSAEPSKMPISGSHVFGGKFPIQNEIFMISVPDTLNISFNVKPDDQKNRDNCNIYTWNRKDVERIKNFPHKPPDYQIAEELVFTTADSWEELGNYIYDELMGELQLINRGKSIEALYSFVRDSIRNIEIPLQFTGFEPFTPGKVIENQYGCPRDKTVLLISLLRSAGYDAFPVLVPGGIEHSRVSLPLGGFLGGISEIVRSHPHISHFGNILTGVKVDDEIRFFDPACEHCHDYIPQEGESCWIIREDTSYFYQIPESNQNKVRVDNQLQLSEDGTLQGEVNIVMKGYFSRDFQRMVKFMKESKKNEYMKSMLMNISMSAMPDTMLINTFKDSSEIILRFNSPDYAVFQGDYITFNIPRNVANTFSLTSLIQSENRDYPLSMKFSNAVISENTELRYPPGFKLTYSPEPVDFRGKGYSIRVESSNKKGKEEKSIEYTRLLQFKEKEISEKTEIFSDLKNFLNERTSKLMFMKE